MERSSTLRNRLKFRQRRSRRNKPRKRKPVSKKGLFIIAGLVTVTAVTTVLAITTTMSWKNNLKQALENAKNVFDEIKEKEDLDWGGYNEWYHYFNKIPTENEFEEIIQLIQNMQGTVMFRRTGIYGTSDQKRDQIIHLEKRFGKFGKEHMSHGYIDIELTDGMHISIGFFGYGIASPDTITQAWLTRLWVLIYFDRDDMWDKVKKEAQVDNDNDIGKLKDLRDKTEDISKKEAIYRLLDRKKVSSEFSTTDERKQAAIMLIAAEGITLSGNTVTVGEIVGSTQLNATHKEVLEKIAECSLRQHKEDFPDKSLAICMGKYPGGYGDRHQGWLKFKITPEIARGTNQIICTLWAKEFLENPDSLLNRYGEFEKKAKLIADIEILEKLNVKEKTDRTVELAGKTIEELTLLHDNITTT